MAAEPVSSVLMTADTVGGVWTYAVELSRALSHAGIQVHLATMGAPLKDWQREQLNGIAGLGLHESGFALEWMHEPWTDVDRAGQWLLQLEQHEKPDVVHLNQFAFGALPFNAPKLMVAHSCVLSWWRAVKRETPPARLDTYRARVAAGLAAADAVVAPTKSMLAALHENYDVPFNGCVIANGLDASAFVPAPKRPCILSAGRAWDEAKNIALLETIAPRVRWPIRVAGDADRALRGVTALGALTPQALREDMSRAAIYAAPASYEPFGLAVLEAALSGCALVLADIPSFRELWGDAAWFVDPSSPPQWRATLDTLAAFGSECGCLAERARRRAFRFTREAMAARYRELYSALATKSLLVAA